MGKTVFGLTSVECVDVVSDVAGTVGVHHAAGVLVKCSHDEWLLLGRGDDVRDDSDDCALLFDAVSQEFYQLDGQLPGYYRTLLRSDRC